LTLKTVVSSRLGTTGVDLVVVLGVSLLARGAFWLVFEDAQSNDITHWQEVIDVVDAGRNPYDETRFLSWPPLWLVVLVSLDAVAEFLQVSFVTALRAFLILVESTLVVALYHVLLGAGASRAAVRRALLAGIALNPVAIVLIIEHGNNDVIVGLFVVLTLGALLAHARSRDVLAWLGGCLFLGLGVLAKTIPLILTPILAPGARRASSAGRALGWVLFLGPAALGLSVIFVLTPSGVTEHVIKYRSEAGRFGITGFLFIFDRSDLLPVVRWAWVFAVIALVALLWRRLSSEAPLGPERLFLLVALLLLSVPVLGPGYAPQYAYWFLPAFIGTYVLLDHEWRVLLRLAYVIASLTYLWEYAILPHYGQFADQFASDSDWLAEVSDQAYPSGVQTLVRLPLFLVAVLIIVEGVRRLARGAKGSRALVPSAAGAQPVRAARQPEAVDER
jgi:hypothetical protein